MMLRKLGIIAGGGALPFEIINFCKISKRPYFVIALKGQADVSPILETSPHKWVRLGAIGKAIKYLKIENANLLVLAGSVTRPSLSSLSPDVWTAKFLAKMGYSLLGDDGLLKALLQSLQYDEGFSIIGPDELLPHLVAKEGVYGKIKPSKEDHQDILIGIKGALSIGKQDVGQAAIARKGKIVAFENSMGTDKLLKSIDPVLITKKEGVLVKMSKPNQELRTDLPTIGPKTIINATKLRLCGIAIEANKSLILYKKQTIKAADESNMFIIGIKKQHSWK